MHTMMIFISSYQNCQSPKNKMYTASNHFTQEGPKKVPS